MEAERGVPRMGEDQLTEAVSGKVVWAPVKSLWLLSNAMIALTAGFAFFSWSALAVFFSVSRRLLCVWVTRWGCIVDSSITATNAHFGLNIFLSILGCLWVWRGQLA